MTRDLLKMAIVLGLMSTLGPFAIDMYLPALTTIAEDFRVDAASVQFTLTGYFIAFGVSQLFYGPASDMFGRKPPIYFGMAIFAAASIGAAFATSVEMLTALRFVQGAGAAGVMSIPRAIIRDRYTGSQATRLMSTVMLVFSVSPMLAPLAGSAVIVPFGWRAVFLVLTIATGFAALLMTFALPETLLPERRTPFKFDVMFRNFGTLLRDPYYMGMTLIGGLGMSAFFTFLGSAPFIYMEVYGLSPTEFAIAFALNALGFFAATQFAATLMARIGASRLIVLSSLGYGATTLLLLGVFLAGQGNLYSLVIILILGNLFMGLIIPSVMVMALEAHGPIAGSAASLGGTLQLLMGSLAMYVGAQAYDGTPVPMLWIVAGCGTGAAALALLTIRERRPVAE